jgi:aspartate carbamoyltransferase catalytic subunit
MGKNTLFGKDILSVDQFSMEEISLVMETADGMRDIVKTAGMTDTLKGKIMTALFYEPSSRTFGSFITAMQRLGGGIIPLQGVTYSSVSKGETLSDTVRTFASYSDVIVIRHPEVGSAKIAAEFAQKPVINAGDGVGEHPTQALLDLYTIQHQFGKMDNLTVTFVGDLLNGRTVHSLSKLISGYPGIAINCVSPDILRMPPELLHTLESRNIKITQMETLDEVIGTTDILYVTRVQKERFSDLGSYEKLKHYYVVTPQTIKPMKRTSIIMHPFPRVGEIAMEVDLDPRAVYINKQMENGMYVRMALLSLILAR